MAQTNTIGGASNLARTLRRAGVEVAELKPVNRDAAEIGMQQAIADAPRRSGNLRQTLRVGATNRAGVIRAGNNRQTGVPYANPIHWGWFKRGIMPNPFVAEAAQKTESRWVALYERFADRVLNKIKGI